MHLEEVEALRKRALQEARDARSPEEAEAVRIRYLGRKGVLSVLLSELRHLPPEERARIGCVANTLKAELGALLQDRSASRQRVSQGPAPDITLPGRWGHVGRPHPISRIIDETLDIFAAIGFTVAEGPDVETAYHNFEALNTPPHHPTWDPQDTFWLDTGELLRTQTSPVQIRVMESRSPPVRVVTPGRCYRRDTTDATHSANFHQIEGLYVDEKVSLADLKGTLSYFVRELLGPSVRIRFRPHFFPFTEPSVECDFSCHLCGSQGCPVCKQSGWIEIAGAGMVDPRVFEKVGYDAERYTGFAFGMGVERIAMIRYGIRDIRLLYENDLRFLEQFD